MIDNQLLIAFLDKIHLFSGLDHTQLGGIAPKLVERDFPAGTVIIKRGEKADGFYMVYKGRVKVTIPHPEKGERQLAWLAPGDYFGEEALFENRERSANISALEDCQLLFLSRDNFNELITKYEKLKPNFKVAIKSHKLARATHFKWLGKNEVIYFIARKHKLLLYQMLVGPVLALTIPGFLLFWGFISGATTPTAVGVVVLVADLLWLIWNAIDWSNDYYIVTNQRVVWMEKVIFLYDSREEAPLGTILSVGVETDMLGRVFDFGHVIVRTFVGKLEFRYVDHPVQAADMIREYWERTKAITTRSQMDVMKDTIKQKLGLPVEKRKQPELSPLNAADEERVAKVPLWLLAMQNLFQLRIEEGGKVIYRKHWVILLQQGWKPFALFLFGNGLWLWRAITIAATDLTFLRENAGGTLSPDTLIVAIPFLMLPVLFWMWYEYTDWKNDTFMVSDDEIFDIDRKPFGQEERRSAQVDSILSSSYKRDGFIAYIFNYGNVTISVGGTNMVFEDVMDPASVQADVNRRRSKRIAKKNEDAGKDDRERFATWLAAYHQNQNEFIMPVDTSKTEAPGSPSTPGQKEFSTGEREAFSNAAADGGIDGDAEFGTGGIDGDVDFQAGE